jgi:xylulokinase
MHTGDDMVRSVLEAVAFDGRGCLDILEENGRRVEEVVLVGGGARSRVWAAIKANIWKRTVILPRITDAASLGAMVLAGTAVGALHLSDAIHLNPPVQRVDPDPDSSARYDEIYAAYRALFTLMAAARADEAGDV